MKRVAIQVAKFALAFGLLVLLIQGGLLDLSQLGTIGDRWPWLLLAQLPLAGLLGVAALRWHLLMRARGVGIRLPETYSILLIGWFFNQTMPSTTGGDVAKAWAVALDHPDRRSDAIVSILVDRLVGLVALLSFALVGGALNLDLLRSEPRLLHFVGVIGLLLLGAVSVLTCFYSARLRGALPIERLERAWVRGLGLEGDGLRGRFYARARGLVLEADRAVYAYRSHPGALLGCVGLSALLHGMTVCVNLCLAWALLGPTFDVRSLFVLVPLAHIGMTLGITPGNVGVGEVIYAELFRWGGIAQGGLICVLQRVSWIAWAVVGAVIFLLRRGRTQASAGEALTESRLSRPVT